jgi:hypothetical protein
MQPKKAGLIAVATGLGLATLVGFQPVLADQNGRPPPIKIGNPAPPPKSSAALPGNINQYLDAALKLPLNPKTFSWSAGMAPVLLEKSATHICLLTEVTGNFAGAGEHIVLRVNQTAPGGATWELTGTSGQPQLRASATCAAKSKFTPGMFGNGNAGFIFPPLSVDTGCGPVTHGTGANGDDFAFFVREVVGKFRGGGESLTVVPNGTTSMGMRVGACSGYAGGALLGLRFGGNGPDGKKGFGGAVKYQGPTGRTVQMGSATWQISDANYTPPINFGGGEQFKAAKPDKLIPVNQGLCGIVMVGGKLQGFGERVRVYQSGGYWVPEVSTAAANGDIHGAFRCIARDQR